MLTVQEYLTTSYEADREYVDAELLERHSGEQPHTRVHGVVASLLCVEILCRLDTPARLNEKLSDYFQMGVRYVWVLDPLSKRAFCYTPGEMREVLDGVLRTNNPDIAVPLADAFEE